MRINVEASVLVDPRYGVLAATLQIPKPEAIGRILAVWAECYRTQRYALPGRELDVAAGLTGFGAAMQDAGLARDDPAGVYVCGTKGRLEWIAELRVRAGRGGKARTGRRYGKRKRTPVSVLLSPTDAHPDAQAPALAYAKASAVGEVSPSPSTARNCTGPSRALKDWLVTTWSDAHEGAKPSWVNGAWVQLARLHKLHGEVGIRARWPVYLTETKDFYAGHPLGKFCSDFDRYAPKAPRDYSHLED